MDFNNLYADINSCVAMFELSTGEFVVIRQVKGLHVMQANVLKAQQQALDYIAIIICLTVTIDGVLPAYDYLMDMLGSDYLKIAEPVSTHLLGK